MPVNHQDEEFVTFLVDLLQVIGPVSARRMFGGHGIFLDGLMFGLVNQRSFYLKTDKQNEHEYQQLKLEKFTYQKQGKTLALCYYEAPAEALEDTVILQHWGNLAYAAALRAAAKKKK